MMRDRDAEERFVNAFIIKRRRERLIYELSTPGKRYDGISRFCHQAERFLDPAKIYMEGADMDSRPEFTRFIRDHGGQCLVLSFEYWPDGQHMTLDEAVREAAVSADVFLILGDGFAMVYGEPEKGGRARYLMFDKQKSTRHADDMIGYTEEI